MMKFLKIVAFMAAAALFAACSSGPSANNQNSAATSNAAKPAPVESAAVPSAGPAATLRALSEASNKNDVAAVKSYLSKGTLARIEEGAKAQNKTIDQLLAEEESTIFPVVPELGAEEISGDTATLEVKNAETNEFEKLPFVLEDGRWKVAIDKFLEEFDPAAAEEPAAKP